MAKSSQDFLREIVGAFMPQMNKQKAGMMEFLRAQALRTGQPMASVAQALRPYAEAAGQGAAEAGVSAAQQAQRAEEYEKQQANWEKQFAANQQQQELANQMAQYQMTGIMTPEMMNRFGFSDISRGDIRSRDRQLEMLGGLRPLGGGGMQSGAQQSTAPWQSGPFGRNNRTLWERATTPGLRSENTAQRRHRNWLMNQFAPS